MKFTYSWLKTHLETSFSAEEIGDRLTQQGFELESLDCITTTLEGFKVAYVEDVQKHPNADRLKVCTVALGEHVPSIQVVCGAANVRPGIKVVLAQVGSVIPLNGMVIKKSVIRGQESYGMLCSAEELCLCVESFEGILELEEHLPLGSDFNHTEKDWLFDINITPNRGDMLCVRGIARELAASKTGVLLPLKKTLFSQNFSSSLTCAKASPYFSGRTIQGIKNTTSPLWLQKRLNSVGLKSISAVVDVTQFILMDLGQPLHVYDADTLEGPVCVEERAGSFVGINGHVYSWEDPLLCVADQKKIISLAGVLGSQDTSAQMNTCTIFLESAYFNSSSTRKSGQSLAIHTDARMRFDRGVDTAMVKEALNQASSLILDICGGQASALVEEGSLPERPLPIVFPVKTVLNVLGEDIPLPFIKSSLESLGFDVDSSKSGVLECRPPSFRHDVCLKQDIVEEIARLYGYDKIPSKATQDNPFYLTPTMDPIAYTLSQKGFDEVMTWSMIPQKRAQLFEGLKPFLKIRNPISQEMEWMRTSLLTGLLETVRKNEEKGQTCMHFFEIGSTYHGLDESDQIKSAAGVRYGTMEEYGLYASQRVPTIYDVKADLCELLNLYCVEEDLQVPGPSWYHPKRSAVFMNADKPVGFFGEIHPMVVKAYGLKNPIVAFEFFPPCKNLSRLSEELVLSSLQSVHRDFAFLVDKDKPMGSLLQSIRSLDQNLISDVVIFDVVEHEDLPNKIPFSKKSVSVRVVLSPKTETLVDAHIKKIYDGVLEIAFKTLGAELRL